MTFHDASHRDGVEVEIVAAGHRSADGFRNVRIDDDALSIMCFIAASLCSARGLGARLQALPDCSTPSADPGPLSISILKSASAGFPSSSQPKARHMTSTAGADSVMNHHFDPMASWARLSERVENQGKDIVDLRSNMNTGFQTLTASINTLSNEVRTNSKPQWTVIWSAAGVCFTILVTIGTFFYGTLSKEQARLDAALVKSVETVQTSVAALADKVVTQKELEWRTARSAEDRARTEAAVGDIRDHLVPRAEHERVWQNYDQRDRDLQRQIDDLKQAQGSVYGQRDVILDLRERLDRIERQKLTGG